MSTPTYLKILANVRHLCLTLSLQLPTHKTAIAAQIRHIQTIRHNLEATQVKVRLLASRSWKLIQRDKYHRLDKLLCSLITEVINMLLLAEEFASDPEGSLSCLRDVNRRKDNLIDQLQLLETAQERQIDLPSALSVATKPRLQTVKKLSQET